MGSRVRVVSPSTSDPLISVTSGQDISNKIKRKD